MLLGLSLGNTMKEAFGISISYVIAGCLGLPVFANSPLGFLYLMSPTGGYLIGFVITIPLISYIHNRLNIGLGKSLLVGVLSIFIPGVIVMSYHFGLKVAIMSGVVPFIIPEIMKISMISLIYKTSTKMGKF
jgi:biotin transport system substrate-specific component